jgi:dienelactone hydrolase
LIEGIKAAYINCYKMRKIYLVLLVVFINNIAKSQVSELKNWLNSSEDKRTAKGWFKFSKIPLSKKEALEATQILTKYHQQKYEQRYGSCWDNRELKINERSMKFYYNVFGDKPKDGRSLFISLHGGGEAPARVNNLQYENQKHLYDRTMQNLEGIYLALRAPTNTWNMWHQDDIDDFINIIIQMAVIKENVNPNKVYLLGYSAGGDGLYQLAPRMADRFAAASMMAGHPGDAAPDNLYNLPFALHVGGEDRAYNRSGLARIWKNMLDSLERENPGHYTHQAEIHEGCGHWMNLRDSMALVWMSKFKRSPYPEKLIWKQDNRYHEQFYWLWCYNFQPRAGKRIVAEYNPRDNSVNIIETYIDAIQVLLNDEMLDLDKPVVFKKNGRLVRKMLVKRTIQDIYETLSDRVDPQRTFYSKVEIQL